MIGYLRGTVQKEQRGEVCIDVHGVGYRVSVPANTWELLREGEERLLFISTYVREDRLDLFGFFEEHTRTLFEKLLEQPGIGPKTSLELCALPRSLLLQAIGSEDPRLLMQVKGIGKKTAEKLIIELKNLLEKYPELFIETKEATSYQLLATSSTFDRDALDALTSLGFAPATAIKSLQNLPNDIKSTAERVTAALRSL